MPTPQPPSREQEARGTERAPRRAFAAPKIERHDRLPEITGFSFDDNF